MTRFSSDDYEEMFPGQGELWHANLRRAIAGRKGQRDLRTLERALLELPEKRLIHGRLAKQNEVCAVGALVLQKRVDKGEDRDTVLAELAAAVRVYCSDCFHTEHDHETGYCMRCVDNHLRHGSTQLCGGYVDDADSDTDDYGGMVTAETGKKAGLTYTLAWRIGQLNDDDFGRCTPEQRYDNVLDWVRRQILPERVAA